MLGISMRMMTMRYPSGSEETRDCLDNGWQAFLHFILPNEAVVLLPNAEEGVVLSLREAPISGIILSGGDDWGKFPQRDRTEKIIFDYARQQGIPILGVCRGAQILNYFLGGKMPVPGDGHSGARHKVRMTNGAAREVNSWHGNVIRKDCLAENMEALARADDGSIESFISQNGLYAGIMWHPEREKIPDNEDRDFITSFLNRVKE